jgi:3-keto-disaccharide hydrolase
MRVKAASFALLVAAGATVFAQQNPYVGRWNLTGTGPDTDKVYWLEVKQNGTELEGRFLNRTAHATPLAWIRVEGNELVFQYGRGEGGPEDPVQACGPIYRAHLENGKLIGHHTPEPCNLPARGAANAPAAAGRENAPAPATAKPPAKTINWVGVRQPTWPLSNANGKHTFGKPVVLVGPGVGLEVWGGQTPGKEQGWKVVDGILLNEPPTYNPVSKEKFRDFRIETEFKLDERQNSGLYIRGRYELQLALGTGNPATAGRQGLLAIYGWKAPDVNAGKAAGEWQTLEAMVVGNHITATLNGLKVHDNAVLPAMTGGALDNDELAPGPIMIQGDHSRVSFRKMVITPITKAGT